LHDVLIAHQLTRVLGEHLHGVFGRATATFGRGEFAPSRTRSSRNRKKGTASTTDFEELRVVLGQFGRV